MNFKNTYLFTFSVLSVLIISVTVLINGCKNNTKAEYTLTGDVIADGKNLVQIHCTKCHALVPVNALQKDVWKHHSLPSMSHYLGISTYMDGYYKGPKDTTGLTITEWQSIVAYYDKLAPDTMLPAKKPIPLMNDWAGFTLKTPPHIKTNAFTTMASVDPYNHKIYTSDQAIQQLTEWDNNFKSRNVSLLPSTAVNAIFMKDATGGNSAVLSCIGRLEPLFFTNRPVNKFDQD
jgi:hypothetical protein